MLEKEHANLRHAMAFCLEVSGGAEAGLRFVGALAYFWGIRGYLSEGREYSDMLLAHPDAQAHTKARGTALNGAGGLALDQGNYASARSRFEESTAIFKELVTESKSSGL